MDSDEKVLKAFIEACAELLDLEIDPTWKPTIAANLQVTLRHGALVAELQLRDEAEPAPVFRA